MYQRKASRKRRVNLEGCITSQIGSREAAGALGGVACCLRHTACTRLAESGLEPKVLQYIMGHANISVTMDLYTHLDFSQIQRRMEEVQEYIRIG